MCPAGPALGLFVVTYMDDRRNRFASNLPADSIPLLGWLAANRTGHLLCPALLGHMFNQAVICYTKAAADCASAAHKLFWPQNQRAAEPELKPSFDR